MNEQRTWRVSFAVALLGARPFGVPPVWAAEPVKDPNDLPAYDRVIEASDREHWAYRPVTRPKLPAVKNASWTANPIDSFILARLEGQGLDAESAGRAATPVAASVSRCDRSAAELRPATGISRRFVASTPGAAWSTGCWPIPDTASGGVGTGSTWCGMPRPTVTNVTPPSPKSGDIATGSSTRSTPTSPTTGSSWNKSPGMSCPTRVPRRSLPPDLIASGRGTTSRPTRRQDRFDQLDDLVRTTSQAFLGLTLACARCHNHKFEPLTMHDYYRMVAVFNPLEQPRNGRIGIRCLAGRRPLAAEPDPPTSAAGYFLYEPFATAAGDASALRGQPRRRGRRSKRAFPPCWSPGNRRS